MPLSVYWHNMGAIHHGLEVLAPKRSCVRNQRTQNHFVGLVAAFSAVGLQPCIVDSRPLLAPDKSHYGDPAAATLNRHIIDIDEHAVCNDGTPSVFYHTPGDSGQWIVYLQGGGWCWDEPTCEERWADSPQLMSSASYGPTLNVSGVLSNDPSISPLSSATKVLSISREFSL